MLRVYVCASVCIMFISWRIRIMDPRGDIKYFYIEGGNPWKIFVCVYPCATTIHAPCTANNSFEYPRYWTIGHHFHRFSNDHPPFFPSTPRRVHQRPTKEKIIEERNAAVEQIFRDPNAFSLSLSLNFSCFHDGEPLRERRRNDFYRRGTYKGTIRFLCVSLSTMVDYRKV